MQVGRQAGKSRKAIKLGRVGRQSRQAGSRAEQAGRLGESRHACSQFRAEHAGRQALQCRQAVT
jgi:hypothetical protein